MNTKRTPVKILKIGSTLCCACSVCEQIYPLDSKYFAPRKAAKHGFCRRCHRCTAEAREKAKHTQWLAENIQYDEDWIRIAMSPVKGKRYHAMASHQFPAPKRTRAVKKNHTNRYLDFDHIGRVHQ